MESMNKRYTQFDIKSKDEDKITIVASTATQDREGEILSAEGWDLKNFKKNPVVLWAHNMTLPPIGKASKIWVEGTGKKGRLMMDVVLHEFTDLAREIKALVMADIVNSVSVGFMPIEREGNVFTKLELLELSFVPVPANAEARVAAKDLNLKNMEVLFEETKEAEETTEEEKPETEKEEILKALDGVVSRIDQFDYKFSGLVESVQQVQSAVGKLGKESNNGRKAEVTKSHNDLRRTLQIIDKAAEAALTKLK